MEIKYKLYPYPVLAEYSDDYSSGKFYTDVKLERDGYDIKVHYGTILESDSLQRLIDTGKARFVFHMECAQTGFRKVLITEKKDDTYTISNKEISGKLQICPFVVAVDDLEEYSSKEFHEDYAGQAFNIEMGCVLAVGRMVTAIIKKDIDELANTPSVFSIIRNADASCRQMLVDMSGRKIIIKLPLEDYYSYKSLSSIPEVQPLLNSLTVIPALTYVLSELKLLTVEERMENQDSLWYKTIKKALLTQFECNIESDDLSNQNVLELAQKLIDNPMTNAFKALTNGFGVSEGDEE